MNVDYSESLQKNLMNIAEDIGANLSEITIVKMSIGVDEFHKNLELIQGNWDDGHPWIIIDENDRVYTLASAESFTQMIHFFASTQNEIFQLKLEKAIWQHFPVDFNDVWAVAMDRIKTLAQTRPENKIVNLDLNWLLNEIKEKYPNLFYQLDQLLAQSRAKNEIDRQDG